MRRSLIVLALALLALPMLAARSPQVGQYRIFLPLVFKPAAPPVEQPRTIFVRGTTSSRSNSYFFIQGEVVNNLGRNVYAVRVTARYYNSANRLVAVEQGYARLDETRGDQPNPFSIVLSSPPADIARFELSLNWSESSFSGYGRATIVNQQVREDYGPEVFGELRNDERRQLNFVEVVVTYYDAAGNVVEVQSGYAAPTTLAPGATGVYQVGGYNRFQFESYRVQAEGFFDR